MENSKYVYQYETHCHTCWCSACAQDTPQDMAQAYYEHGYAGMVITDHFLLGNTAVDRSLPWEDMMSRYYEAYLAAADWAKGKDFDVLFGIEHNYGNGKEALTYGISLEFLLDHPGLHRLPPKEYYAAVHEAGGFVSMAHPYRDRGYIDMSQPLFPEYHDALEVFNFYNYPQENRKAEKLARREGMQGTSGGDEHRKDGGAIGQAGILLQKRVHTGAELVEVLRSRDYRILVDGEARSCTF